MKKLQSPPDWAIYIGTSDPDGYTSEELADRLDRAIDPAFFQEQDGAKSFFDLAREIK